MEQTDQTVTELLEKKGVMECTLARASRMKEERDSLLELGRRT